MPDPPTTFTFFVFIDCTFGTRLRLAFALLVTPITVLFIGRSPRVTLRSKKGRA